MELPCRGALITSGNPSRLMSVESSRSRPSFSSQAWRLSTMLRGRAKPAAAIRLPCTSLSMPMAEGNMPEPV